MLDVAIFSQDDAVVQKLRHALEDKKLSVELYGALSNQSSKECSRKFDLIFVHSTPSVMDSALPWVGDLLLAKSAAVIALVSEQHMAFAPALLDAGFDSCLSVSLDDATLCAVARALTRRKQGMTASVSHYGVLSFNHVTQQAYVLGVSVALTGREAQVLDILLKRVGQIIPQTLFIQDLALGNIDLNTSVAEVYIHRLRKKISHDILPIRNIKRCGYYVPRYLYANEYELSSATFFKRTDDLIRSSYEFVGDHLAV
jgi:DNA-binding response OmpR family regulator